MKAFPRISSNEETNNDTSLRGNPYKTLDELGFADLYVEVPEQDFSHIKQMLEGCSEWIHNKRVSLHSLPAINYHPHFHYPKSFHGIR